MLDGGPTYFTLIAQSWAAADGNFLPNDQILFCTLCDVAALYDLYSCTAHVDFTHFSHDGVLDHIQHLSDCPNQLSQLACLQEPLVYLSSPTALACLTAERISQLASWDANRWRTLGAVSFEPIPSNQRNNSSFIIYALCVQLQREFPDLPLHEGDESWQLAWLWTDTQLNKWGLIRSFEREKMVWVRDKKAVLTEVGPRMHAQK